VEDTEGAGVDDLEALTEGAGVEDTEGAGVEDLEALADSEGAGVED